MKDWLLRAFAYDHWANRIWLAYAMSLPNPEEALEVVGRMLAFHRTWAQRCDAQDLPDGKDHAKLIDAFLEVWIQVTKKRQLAEHVVYRDEEGKSMVRPYAEIAFHVIDGGSFFRGELQAIARLQGRSDFPRADMIHFLDTRA